MGYSILKYGCPMLTGIEDLEQAKKEVLRFVTSAGDDFIEVRGADDQTVTIGYFDGRRFHWTKDKGQAEAWKNLGYVTRLPLWHVCRDDAGIEGRHEHQRKVVK